MDDESSRTELIEQIWYYQNKVADLEEQLDECEIENDDLKYELYELKGDKDEK